MITTDRLKIRAWREADKPLLGVIHADPEVMPFLAVGGPTEVLASFYRAVVERDINAIPSLWKYRPHGARLKTKDSAEKWMEDGSQVTDKKGGSAEPHSYLDFRYIPERMV